MKPCRHLPNSQDVCKGDKRHVNGDHAQQLVVKTASGLKVNLHPAPRTRTDRGIFQEGLRLVTNHVDELAFPQLR